MRIHEWADGSGISLSDDDAVLTVWDSGGTEWVWDMPDPTESYALPNAYWIATEYRFTDAVDGLSGNYIGDENGQDGGWFDISELAYGMTYADGFEDVSWRRLGELLSSHDVADALSLVGIDPSKWENPDAVASA